MKHSSLFLVIFRALQSTLPNNSIAILVLIFAIVDNIHICVYIAWYSSILLLTFHFLITVIHFLW